MRRTIANMAKRAATSLGPSGGIDADNDADEPPVGGNPIPQSDFLKSLLEENRASILTDVETKFTSCAQGINNTFAKTASALEARFEGRFQELSGALAHYL